MWRDDALLLDILIAARHGTEFTSGLTSEEFSRNVQAQYATMRCISIIGEAASKVSNEFRGSHPEIPWQEMVGMRHRLVHDYFRVDIDKVWLVAKQDLPELVARLAPLVPPDRT
jgi:uncharacterized protein with HEPN domain